MSKLRQARDDDNFREMLRRMATARVVDLSYPNLLEGPEKTWPKPETVEQAHQAEAARSRRRQGLPTRIRDRFKTASVARLVRDRG